MRRAVPVLLLLFGCAHRDSQRAMTIPLRWALSAEDMRDVVSAVAVEEINRQSVQVGDFVDARPDRSLVGRNIEKDGGGTVATPDDVGKFAEEQLARILRANGVKLGDTRATRIVTGEVRRFFVVEENTYQTHVAIKFRVANMDGQEVWQGVSEGSSHRFGRSFKADNYQEALCNAFLEAVKALLENQDFLKSFRG